MKYRFFCACLVACALAAAVACSKSNPASPTSDGGTAVTSPGSGTGQLRVSMKDGPFVEASAVLVKISDVSVHMSGDKWQPLTLDGTKAAFPVTCNLTALAKQDNLLGLTTLAAGHYTQLRVTVTDAKLYMLDASAVQLGNFLCGPTSPTVTEEAVPLTIPSGELKINHQFTIGAGSTTTLQLDFDAASSVKKTGNGKYTMSPVISVVSTTTAPTTAQ